MWTRCSPSLTQFPPLFSKRKNEEKRMKRERRKEEGRGWGEAASLIFIQNSLSLEPPARTNNTWLRTWPFKQKAPDLLSSGASQMLKPVRPTNLHTAHPTPTLRAQHQNSHLTVWELQAQVTDVEPLHLKGVCSQHLMSRHSLRLCITQPNYKVCTSIWRLG